MEEKFEVLHQQELETSINTLRAILNEMCCTIDESEINIEKLNISQQLDTLIVEYMVLEKTNVATEYQESIQQN